MRSSALLDLPFPKLIFQAQTTARLSIPLRSRFSTLLSIKTGGCLHLPVWAEVAPKVRWMAVKPMHERSAKVDAANNRPTKHRYGQSRGPERWHFYAGSELGPTAALGLGTDARGDGLNNHSGARMLLRLALSGPHAKDRTAYPASSSAPNCMICRWL